MKNQYLQYWGKTRINEDGILTYHPVAYHGLDVAAVLTALIKNDPRLAALIKQLDFCDPDCLIPFFRFLASLHDVGKFSESFQNLNPGLFFTLQGKQIRPQHYYRHDLTGYLVFSEHLFDQFFKSESNPRIIADPQNSERSLWILLHSLISAITGHHGVPPSPTGSTLKKIFSPDVLADINQYADDCKQLFFKDLQESTILLKFRKEKLSKIAEISYVFAGSLVISDWIASNTTWFEYVQIPLSLEEYWEQYALPQAECAIKNTGILPVPISQASGFSALFQDIKHLHPIQELCERVELQAGPGLYIIEDQCGMGKTESSLVLAHRLMNKGLGEGIFFALPTMATANAMFKRMGDFYSRLFSPANIQPEIVLTHSMSEILDKINRFSSQESDHYSEDGEISGSARAKSWLLDSRKKALLAHAGVGTIDQALMAILTFRHQSLRLFGLMRNILIIDEVHSYDLYVHRLLCHLIEYHSSYGGSTILLSATLPLSTKTELIQAFKKGTQSSGQEPSSLDYPLFTICTENRVEELSPGKEESRTTASHKPVCISTVQSWHEILTIVKKTIYQGRCIAYIRNTVEDARDAYRIISKHFGTEKIILFHARFTISDRLKLEEEIISRFGKESTIDARSGWVVIATQVLEQSLDVDFDLMITDLAPADLLIQRVGRVHRHNLSEPYRYNDRGEPTLIIRAPSVDSVTDTWYESLFPLASHVYKDHGRLYLSLLAFSKRKTVVFPDDTRDIIEEVYGKDKTGIDSLSRIPAELIGHTLEAQGEYNTSKTMAGLNVLDRKKGYLFSTTHWDEDVYTPTRLSEQSCTVFFAKREDKFVVPIYGKGIQGWYMSRIHVPEHQISKGESPIQDKIEDFPMRQEDCIIVMMEQDGYGWHGFAQDSKGRIKVMYDVKLGFSITHD